jgi:predicted nucleotidyltransferase
MLPDPALAQRLLVERLVAAANPERIILFGSRARGDHRPDSDFDVLVVMRQDIAEPWQMARKLRRAVGLIGYGKDIVVTDHRRLDEERGLNGSMVGMAMRDGKEIWPHAA